MNDDADWQLKVAARPDLTRLKETLLAKAGTRFQRNSFISKELDRKLVGLLSKRGKFFKGDSAAVRPMEMSRCHENSLTLTLKENMEWWTGLALSEDGIWRVRSWCVKKGKIVETTELRTWYFGAMMSDTRGNRS